MAEFEELSVSEALERSLRNAKHLRAMDSATVAAARALARKIDAWDVIVSWALEDAEDAGGRPAVPANDNVSLSSFLKYQQALGLISPVDDAGGASSASSPAAAPPQSKVVQFRQRAGTARGRKEAR